MVTPFDEKGAVDYEQAKKLALALINSGSDGLVVVGTTGESPTVTSEEKLRLFGEIKSAVGDKASVVANTGNYSTAESRELTREAERLGVDACLLVVPYYNKPRTVTSLSAETVIRLSQIDNIIGVKEASGNLEQNARIISGARQDFRVWSGNDGDTPGGQSAQRDDYPDY